jgi:hypothetical protein
LLDTPLFQTITDVSISTAGFCLVHTNMKTGRFRREKIV